MIVKEQIIKHPITPAKIKNHIFQALLYAGLIFFSMVMLLPFFWMLSTSLKPESEVFTFPIKWIPTKFMFGNYPKVFEISSFVKMPRAFLNTMLITVPTTVVGVLTAALAAFAFAKITFPGRGFLFMFLLLTMAIPGVITMIPSYIIFVQFGWFDSFAPLMIPAMMGGAGAIFFTRQFMKGIPREMEEAAKVDGMNWWKIFWVIEVPLSKPILITNFLFGFLAGYNDYMGPLIYLQSPDKFTLQLALTMLNDTFSSNWGVVMAGSAMALIPTVVLFIFAQRYFVEGISLQGLKG